MLNPLAAFIRWEFFDPGGSIDFVSDFGYYVKKH